MAVFLHFYHCFFLLLFVTVVHGSKGQHAMIHQTGTITLPADFFNMILPAYIDSQVEHVLGRLLDDNSFFERVSQFKENQQQLKRRFQDMEKRLKTLEHQRDQSITDIENLVKKIVKNQKQSDTRVRNLFTKMTITQDHLIRVEEIVVSMSGIVSRNRGNYLEMSEKLERETDSIWGHLRRFNVTYWNDMTRVRNDVQEIDNQLSNTTEILETDITSLHLRLEKAERDRVELSQNFTWMERSLGEHISNISNFCECVDKSVSVPLSTLPNGAKTATTSTFPSATRKSTYIETTNSTTMTPQEINGLLVVKRWGGKGHYPKLINIHTGKMSAYSDLWPSHILDVIYDPTSQRIIFSRYFPDAIYSIGLDAPRVDTIKTGVRSGVMAIDVGRRLIFMATYHSRDTISRMTTRGKDYHRIADMTDDRSYDLNGIAIDESRRMIYISKIDSLFSLDYDGENIRTLETGKTRIYALAFDQLRSCLYYSFNTKVIRKSLTSHDDTEIMELDDMSKFVLYNNSLYISYSGNQNIDVIHLENNVHMTLGTMENYRNMITFIP